MTFTLIKRLNWIACIALIGCIMSGCSNEKYREAEKPTIGVPKTIVNLRTGPGTDYDIVTGLLTTDTLTILSDTSVEEEWFYVETLRGKNGYVSAKYINIIEESASYNGTKAIQNAEATPILDERSNNNFDSGAGTTKSTLLTAYPSFIMTSGAGSITLFILFVISLVLCFWLSRWYNYTIKPGSRGKFSPAIGYTVVALSMIFTIFEIAGIFSIRNGASQWDTTFAMMILSTSLPMAVIPWYIRLSGRYSLRDHSESDRVVWGERIGFIGWSILLVPLCIFYIQGASNLDLSTGDGSFGGMLINLAIYAVSGFVFCKYIWCYIIVKYLFKSMNSVILGILNVVLVVGIGRYTYEMFYDSYNGLTFIVAAWAWFIITCYLITVPITTVNEKRCANCHNFSGQQTGSTDLGSTYSSSTKWEDAGTSDISRRHAGSEISNSRRKVRVTTRTDKWRTHHQCPYCSKEWDLDHSESREVGRETLERSWTETY